MSLTPALITSARNPKLRWLHKMASDRRARRREGVWVVEGVRLAEEVLKTGLQALLWVIDEEWHSDRGRESRLMATIAARGDPLLVVKRGVLRDISTASTPPGVIVAFSAPQWDGSEVLRSEEPLVLLDRLQDPGNLGTIARSAEGAGAVGLILTAETADPGNPKALRASAGSLLRLPLIRTEDVVTLLKDSGRKLVATSGASGTSYDQVNLCNPFVLMLGQEGGGLAPHLEALADLVLCIPMAGQLESLNVATACSVILFEAARQRRIGRQTSAKSELPKPEIVSRS